MLASPMTTLSVVKTLACQGVIGQRNGILRFLAAKSFLGPMIFRFALVVSRGTSGKLECVLLGELGL
jgi:hypothetical protein